MTVQLAQQPWPTVRAVLVDAGVDPRDVREAGITVHGYWNAAGDWAEWPEGVGARVLEAAAADVAAGRSRDRVPA